MRISGAVLLGVLTFGCSTTTNSASGGSPDGGPNGTGANETSALTCTGILECAGACGEGADYQPCEDACVAKGAPDAKTKVNAIVACITEFSCEDEACFQDNCSTQLVACLTPPAGAPLTGNAPAGDIPAEMVGKWYSHGDLWEFRADGSLTYGGSVNTSGCASGNVESGTGVASDGTLTVYFTSGGVSICGGSSGDPYVPNTKKFSYRLSTYDIDGATRQKLSLTDLACVEKNNGDDLYCINGFDKQ